jgi:hypothetical protein
VSVPRLESDASELCRPAKCAVAMSPRVRLL